MIFPRKNGQIARRINLMLRRIGDAVKNASISVTDYNADPVEFVYTFSSKEEAENYANSKIIIDEYNLIHRVVGNKVFEYHPVIFFHNDDIYIK